MTWKRRVLITGGAGFIGSHLVRLFVKKYADYLVVNFDKLTYAGNLDNLLDIRSFPNYRFVQGDIRSVEDVSAVFKEFDITDVLHLAAESHVDRSISAPMDFVLTNVQGTVTLLNQANEHWKKRENHRFHHVSTDEVYGSLGEDGFFTEETKYDPRSPYSASKAASDHFVRAYHHTYGLNTVISNCSNNYGSHHFPEKLIPLMIHNIIEMKPLPVYGSGMNVRDWLWVEDHVQAIDLIFHNGRTGESYNIGGLNEWTNIDLVRYLCSIMDKKLGRNQLESEQLIRFVTDRAGHDLRYAIDANKLKTELGWSPSITFEEGLEKTVDWYLNNQAWVNRVVSGAYQDYIKEQYKNV
jgi:dTDP-glucose 4,6-dehydratase